MNPLQMSPLRAVLAGVLALLVGSLASLTVGVSPFATLGTIFTGAVSSAYALGVTANAAVPLILLGLSFAFGLRGHVINVGLQGQFLLGAAASVLVATQLNSPAAVLVPACFAAGALGGALWALVPALMKIWLGTNEIVTTLLMNFIAVYLIAYLLRGPLQDPESPLAQSKAIPQSARLPFLIPDSRMSAGIIVALGCLLLIGLLLKYTMWGFKVRSVGMSPTVARYAGFRVQAITIQVFLISGAFSGLAGTLVILGDQYRLQEGIIDYWYIGIVVGLIGGGSALAILIAGVFFGALYVGGFEAQLTLGVPASIVSLMQGLVIVSFLLVARVPDSRAYLRGALKLLTFKRAQPTDEQPTDEQRARVTTSNRSSGVESGRDDGD